MNTLPMHNSALKNDHDSVIWLKLDKHFFKTHDDRYIVAIYIPPENSPVYNVTDVDLFRKLEIEIGLYLQRGEVYLIGDLNSRIGKKQDYVINNSSRVDIENNVTCIDQPQRRLSADIISNRFGDCLLDLCKAVNICIVNGRLFENTNRMTFFTAYSESLVVYVVTSHQNFHSFSDLKVHDSNEFSNHAPLSFSLKIGTQWSAKRILIYENRRAKLRMLL